jgi:hypothetical protein
VAVNVIRFDQTSTDYDVIMQTLLTSIHELVEYNVSQ